MNTDTKRELKAREAAKPLLLLALSQIEEARKVRMRSSLDPHRVSETWRFLRVARESIQGVQALLWFLPPEKIKVFENSRRKISIVEQLGESISWIGDPDVEGSFMVLFDRLVLPQTQSLSEALHQKSDVHEFG